MNEYKKLFDLTGRRALVVGAGSGIGEACAHGLAAFGAEVLCADLRGDAVKTVAGAIRDEGGRAHPVELDIRSADSVERAREAAGELDVVVTTPSINVRKPFFELSDEEVERVLDVNLRGTFRILREFGRGMAERGRGSLIAFASIRAFSVEPGQSVYAATKSGTLGLVRTLAAEVGEKGVRVNAVAPGVVETPLTAQIKSSPDWYQAYADRNAFRRWAKPSEMVGAVVYLASDASSYVTGSCLVVDAGWLAMDGRFTPPL